MEEKVALVEEHRATHGLNRCLEALGLSKGTHYYRLHGTADRRASDEVLKKHVVAVIEENPAYGYRRIKRELEERCSEVDAGAERVNHKRIRRVLKSYDLTLKRSLPRSRPSAVGKLVAAAGGAADLVKNRSFSVLEAFSTDFKEFVYDQGRKKAWVMVLLDIESRWVGGFAVGASRNRSLALEAFGCLQEAMRSLGRIPRGTVVHHDKDYSVYTSHQWLEKLLLEERVKVSYAQRGARDNPWIESFWGRFSVENAELILEAKTLEEVKRIVAKQLDYYTIASEDTRRWTTVDRMR
ncbi:MAG: IS3 family transposase [Actinobacteria bacterium]|nr:IS3 family transposase [Actinomycetota bacterium]